jgi:hypothetical protein
LLITAEYWKGERQNNGEGYTDIGKEVEEVTQEDSRTERRTTRCWTGGKQKIMKEDSRLLEWKTTKSLTGEQKNIRKNDNRILDRRTAKY